jgi:hypothetical protein
LSGLITVAEEMAHVAHEMQRLGMQQLLRSAARPRLGRTLW